MHLELKENRALFARMLVVAKARDTDLKHAIGTYEFSVVPRGLFAADGSLLHATSKSDLVTSSKACQRVHKCQRTIKNLVLEPTQFDLQTRRHHRRNGKSAITRQAPAWIANCSDLAKHFIERYCHIYSDYDKVHLNH